MKRNLLCGLLALAMVLKMVGDSGNYCDPSFKPDYNEELLRRNNYICHFLLFSREILERTGGLDGAYDGAQDHEIGRAHV